MITAFAVLAFAALATAGGVSSAIAPAQSPPAGCSPNYDGTFNISPVNVSTNGKRDLESRDTPLGITLKNGILTDPQGRTGYIASNSQFQFDDPPQAGAIWTAGFTVCQNSRLTLGNDQTWFKCLSGSFYNIYFKNVLSTGQCIESYIDTVPVGAGHPAPVPASFSTESFANATASASSSGVPSNNTANNTATASGVSSSSSGAGPTTKHTRVGHTTVVGHHTTAKPSKTQTTKGGKGTPAASASSSSSAGAGEAVSVGSEMFGLAAGLLAFAMF